MLWLILPLIIVLILSWMLLIPTIDAWRCEAIIKKHSATFYQAFSTIRSRQRREGIFAVYAFCRYVDDIIDEEHDIQKLKLAEKKLKRFVSNREANDFRFRALKRTSNLFYSKSYDFQPYFDMIQGQQYDSNPVLVKNYEELEQYCDWVASSVGMMLLPILAPQQEVTLKPFALALGRAFQITNILRDVGEDFRRDRIYLPAQLLREFNVNLSEVIEEKITPTFIQLWEFLAGKAERYYEQALKQIKVFPRDTQFPLAAALFFYREILNACRQSNYQVIHQKNYVKQEQKITLLKQVKSFLSV
jgi:phytoene/squalene synthetase